MCNINFKTMKKVMFILALVFVGSISISFANEKNEVIDDLQNSFITAVDENTFPVSEGDEEKDKKAKTSESKCSGDKAKTEGSSDSNAKAEGCCPGKKKTSSNSGCCSGKK